VVSQGQVRRQRHKQRGSALVDEDLSSWTGSGSGSGGGQSDPGFVFGYGRHNPNQARRKFGKKNKSKRKD